MFYFLAKTFFWIYFKLYHRLAVRGRTELDRLLLSSGNSPMILAANHASYLDPPLIGAVFPLNLRFIAWDGLFKNRVFGALIKALGAVPVDQQNKNSAASLLRHIIGFVEDGFSVLIFPEGERTRDGTLEPLEPGVALISAKTGAPILPVWIEGTWEAYPRDRLIPRPHKITVVYGKPISPADFQGLDEREKRRAIMGKLRESLENMRDALRSGGNEN